MILKKIIQWLIIIILVLISINIIYNYFKRGDSVIREYSGIYPTQLDDGSIVLYYNNWSYAEKEKKDFEISFYKMNLDRTWSVNTIKPTMNDKNLNLYKMKSKPIFYAISIKDDKAIRWDYTDNSIIEISSEKLPPRSSLSFLIITRSELFN